jgi:hypothetical protein
MGGRNILDMTWRPELAYAIGLLTTDGNLSTDGRHISLTSKDIEQIKTFISILSLKNKIGIKYSSRERKRKYFLVQFGSVDLYRFLQSIGLTPNKTKTIGRVLVPGKFFRDFLRGHLDGDGSTYSYWDSRWKSSFMLYTVFISASEKHLEWIRDEIAKRFGIMGRLRFSGKSTYQLRFAKRHSVILFERIYYQENLPCLERKRTKLAHAVDTASLSKKSV